MGYLLPVYFTQYQEYQNRIKPVKPNEHPKVESIKRIYLSQQNNLLQSKAKQRKKTVNSAQQVYAEITGVGGKFNAKI